MPISKERMQSLISAAQEYVESSRALRREVIFIVNRVRLGAMTQEDALAALLESAHVNTPSEEAVATIANEDQWQRRTASTNEMKRRWMAQQRAIAKGEPLPDDLLPYKSRSISATRLAMEEEARQAMAQAGRQPSAEEILAQAMAEATIAPKLTGER